jgi:multiple sugar transport system permease protein
MQMIILERWTKNTNKKILIVLLLGFISLLALFPIYWMFVTSIKPLREIASLPPTLFTSSPQFGAYTKLFAIRNFGPMLVNSIVVSTLSMLFCLASGIPAAYSLARLDLSKKFNDNMSFWILSTRMFPPIVSAIPLFLLFRRFGLYNTRTALIIPYCAFNLPLTVWVLKGIFRDIPKTMEEAAMVDGDSRLSAFVKITLPLALPSIFAVGVLAFVFSWNEFLFALILTSDLDSMTLPIGIWGASAEWEFEWDLMCAAGTIAVIPVIALSVLIRKYLIRGLTYGISR